MNTPETPKPKVEDDVTENIRKLRDEVEQRMRELVTPPEQPKPEKEQS